MAFTAMVGKELLELDYDEEEEEENAIMSTYVPTQSENEQASEETTEEDNAEDKEDVNAMKAARPSLSMLGDDDDDAPTATDSTVEETGSTSSKSESSKINGSKSNDSDTNGSTHSGPRRRFKETLSESQIEEAKATGRAQLGLAFEMLTMMKKRALKADPEAYQSLVDACGRVGDTKRASDLLAIMHEDGIVADGTVYACLVSAFSSETAWKKGTKEEDLPGKRFCTEWHPGCFADPSHS